MKRHTHLYDNVLQWDDSAGEKAFKDAKSRFWSKFNGLSSDDASLPDPNAYIDDVDWESGVNSDLVHDLETETETETETEQIRDDSVYLTEELLTKLSFSCSGRGEAAEEGRHREDEGRAREAVPWVASYGCGAKGVLKSNLLEGASWGENGGRRNKKATGWYDSRYKTSRFPVSYECRANRAASFAHEKHVLRQWAMKS